MCAFANVSPGLKSELRAMVVIQCPERADHSEIVRAFADAFEPIPDDQAAFPIRLVARLERHDELAVSMRRVPADNIGVYFFRIEHRFVGDRKSTRLNS